jgi:hypothetical protein
MRKMKGGGYERLAFDKSGRVIETKNMRTGAVHSPSEFAADRRRSALTGKGAR